MARSVCIMIENDRQRCCCFDAPRSACLLSFTVPLLSPLFSLVAVALSFCRSLCMLVCPSTSPCSLGSLVCMCCGCSSLDQFCHRHLHHAKKRKERRAYRQPLYRPLLLHIAVVSNSYVRRFMCGSLLPLPSSVFSVSASPLVIQLAFAVFSPFFSFFFSIFPWFVYQHI